MARPGRIAPWRRDFAYPQTLIPAIRAFGYDRFTHARPGDLSQHTHPGHYEICYLVSGTVEWWNDDGLVEVHPGDVYFTRPGERHGGRDSVMHSCELYWMVLRLPRTFVPVFARMQQRTFHGGQVVAEVFASILNEFTAPGNHAEELIRARVVQLLVECSRAHDRPGLAKPEPSPAIRQTMEWMQQQLAQELSVQEAAKVAQLSLSRFHERFAAETGFSPSDYHTRLRLHRARQLLVETTTPITQLAFGLGFSSSQYFATVFRNHLGVTPREYRLRNARVTSRPGSSSRSTCERPAWPASERAQAQRRRQHLSEPTG